MKCNFLKQFYTKDSDSILFHSNFKAIEAQFSPIESEFSLFQLQIRKFICERHRLHV